MDRHWVGDPPHRGVRPAVGAYAAKRFQRSSSNPSSGHSARAGSAAPPRLPGFPLKQHRPLALGESGTVPPQHQGKPMGLQLRRTTTLVVRVQVFRRRFERPRFAHGRVVAGVCAALARVLHVPVRLLRWLTIFAGVLATPLVVGTVYALLWILTPVTYWAGS